MCGAGWTGNRCAMSSRRDMEFGDCLPTRIARNMTVDDAAGMTRFADGFVSVIRVGDV